MIVIVLLVEEAISQGFSNNRICYTKLEIEGVLLRILFRQLDFKYLHWNEHGIQLLL